MNVLLHTTNVDGTLQKSDWDSKDGRAEADEDDYFKKVSSSDSQAADSLLLWYGIAIRLVRSFKPYL